MNNKKTHINDNFLHHGLHINGTYYNHDQLIRWCNEQLLHVATDSWQAEIYRFILSWLDHNDYVVCHTSGSTGIPQQIAVSKQHIANSANTTLQYFGLQKGDNALLCMNARYIGGRMMIVRAMLGELNLWCVEPSSEPLQQIKQTIQFAAMVPLQVQKALQSREQLQRIEKLIIGGAPLDIDDEQTLQNVTTRCFATYGMTETVSHVAIRPLNNCTPNEKLYFNALPHVSFTTDHRGCLVIDAPLVTHHTITTNDIVQLLSPQQFRWVGRYDFVINSGGVKIQPETVEQKLQPHINQTFVITSLPSPILGEQVVMVLEQFDATERDFTPIFKQYLDKYEIPKRVLFVAQLPLTASGKINRTALKKLLVDKQKHDDM